MSDCKHKSISVSGSKRISVNAYEAPDDLKKNEKKIVKLPGAS